MPRLFRVEVDSVRLADELFAFVTDPQAASRNDREVVRELHDVNPEAVEVLESMVLDGVDQRRHVEEYVVALVGQYSG